jgi:hypothetical protein
MSYILGGILYVTIFVGLILVIVSLVSRYRLRKKLGRS